MQPRSAPERVLSVAAPGLHKVRYDEVKKACIVKREPRVRRITVGSLYRPAKKGSLPTTVPFIRLSGKWLEKAGFTTGDMLEIEASEGKIALKFAGRHSGETNNASAQN